MLLGVAVSPVVAQAPGPSASPAPATGSAIRIAYIDVQRVLARSSAGVAAREQLEREKAVMQREMEGKRQELEKLRDELEKKGSLMTPDARRERQEQFERKRRDAARQMDDFQKELEKKEQALLQRVLQELSGVIDRVGKERGYYLIVEKRGASVLYASPDADLTELRRDNVGFVFQFFNLLPVLNAEENIMLPLRLAGRDPDPERLAALIDAVDLGDRLSHRPAELSGGQQQRVAIARALLAKPAVVFADEPTGNLDSHSSEEVLALLRRAVDEFGQTVVMVTHDPAAASTADRVLVLVDGRIVRDAPAEGPDQVLDLMKQVA